MKKLIVHQNQRVGPWVCERTGGTWSAVDSQTVGLEDNGELIAGVVFDHYNGATLAMHVASDGTKRWLNRELLKFCFDYAFNQAGVTKVIGIVGSNNSDALKFDRHLGFVEEARIAQGHPDGDLIFLTMRRDQCRWIRNREDGTKVLAAASA